MEVPRLDSKCLSPRSHLTSPPATFQMFGTEEQVQKSDEGSRAGCLHFGTL